MRGGPGHHLLAIRARTDLQYSKSVQVRKSLYSDPHLPLMIAVWSHAGLAQRRRAVALPALKDDQTATSSLPLHTLPHCTQHQRVYWLQDPVINKLSIFCSPRCLANIKGGKGWCGISVCLHSTVQKASPTFSPEIQAGSSRGNVISRPPRVLPGR